jgi:hypothetical protein
MDGTKTKERPSKGQRQERGEKIKKDRARENITTEGNGNGNGNGNGKTRHDKMRHDTQMRE